MMMSSKDTWRELAELLGLPADEPPPPTVNKEMAAPSPAPAAPEEPDDLDDEPLPSSLAEQSPIERDEDDDEFFVPPFPTDSSDDVEVTAFEAVTLDSGLEPNLDDDALGEPSQESTEPKSADDKPREGRRRRRGRRGRRRGGEEGEPGTQAEAPEGAAPEGEPETAVEGETDSPEVDDEPRGRRRGRRQDSEGEDVATVVEDEDAEVPGDSADDGDDFSKDAWADWNVPLWQELIDGLYRPDRDR